MTEATSKRGKLRSGVLPFTLAIFIGVGVGTVLAQRTGYHAQLALHQITPLKQIPLSMSRPYGMAPVAYEAYIRACNRSCIHPFRVGQTIGDHPLSVGYHKRDGVLRVKGERVDYCAAVDLGVWDLPPQKINQFVDALASQGFAAWYRHGGKWKGGEHIHAIYAFLPMKPQLQVQLGQFLRERRREGRRVWWQKKLRRQRRKLKHWML